MKMGKSFEPQPRAKFWRARVNATQFLNQIELRFWRIAMPLMMESRLVRKVLKFFYDLLGGQSWRWLAKVGIISGLIFFLLGFILGFLVA